MEDMTIPVENMTRMFLYPLVVLIVSCKTADTHNHPILYKTVQSTGFTTFSYFGHSLP